MNSKQNFKSLKFFVNHFVKIISKIAGIKYIYIKKFIGFYFSFPFIIANSIINNIKNGQHEQQIEF